MGSHDPQELTTGHMGSHEELTAGHMGAHDPQELTAGHMGAHDPQELNGALSYLGKYLGFWDGAEGTCGVK